MALINVATKEIHCKLVYLKYIYSTVPGQARGDLLSIDTETERTLFFDFLPLDLGKVHGYQVRFHLYTVPGQVLYERTRVAVLNGADGVVFTADSQRSKLGEDVRSLQELARNLTQQGKRFLEFPMVMQYNKRDMPDALPLPVLEKYLNSMHVPAYEAVAAKGVGVFDTLRTISKMIVGKL